MLIKILLLGLAVWLILKLLKQYRNTLDTPTPPQSHSQDIVRCAHCGLHIPKAESIHVSGEYFCCIEHSQQSK